MKNFFHHLFLPRHSNNFRAKILHSSVITVLIISLFSGSIGVSFLKKNHPEILGISYSITLQELLQETNQKRLENGVAPLKLDESLNQAAEGKAHHMMVNHYWAHFAPDGTTPWVFIKDAGYEYTYAGENLAKGFTNSSDIVIAWMNSPSHRENLLSQKYSDIGFAILEGNLEDEDTVLVVQMFGSRIGEVAAVPEAQKVPVQKQEIAQEHPVPESSKVLQEEIVSKPVVNAPTTTKTLGIVLLAFFALILILDFMIVERRRIPRIAGHNIDHIILIAFFMLFMILEKSEGIL